MGHLCPGDPGQVCFQFITKRSEVPGGRGCGERADLCFPPPPLGGGGGGGR